MEGLKPQHATQILNKHSTLFTIFWLPNRVLLLTESTVFFLNLTSKHATSSTDPVALEVKDWVSGIDTTASGTCSSTFIDDELCPVVEEPELSLTTLVRSRKTPRAATSVRV